MVKGDSKSSFGLRKFIEDIESISELKKISGAHWDLEMSNISHLICSSHPIPPPALLFDDIPDYPNGYRTMFGMTNSVNRAAIAYGMEPNYTDPIEFIKDYRIRSKEIEKLESMEPTFINPKNAPVFENKFHGEDVNLLSLPVPMHHELDGGRFIGTADCIITKNPADGRVNLGTYRMQVFDKNRLGAFLVEGKHGWLDIMDHFENSNEPMPIAATFGQDPTLFIFASIGLHHETKWGEYGPAGAVRGEPFPVVEGPVTGIPIPANAEIAIEGWIYPGDAEIEGPWKGKGLETEIEGPFGEWAGYYGRAAGPEPLVRVEALYHRNDPIMACAVPAKPPYDYSYHKSLTRSANLWDQIEAAGVPNVTGVWRTEAGGSRLFNIISIKNRYPGHPRQTAHIAAHCRAGGQSNRWTIVVDDDIDITDLNQVAWAMASRCLPARDIEISDGGWAHKSVPEVDEHVPLNSRIMVDACIPYEQKDSFSKVAEASPELKRKIMDKWSGVLTGKE
jgi:3-polyprenyl-4-hydroxybenzoate decarboxylase